MTHATRDAIARAAARRTRRVLTERWRAFTIIAAAILVLDQVTKLIIRATMDPRQSHELFPGFSITRVTNKGIAFGLFPGRQVAVAILTVVALCGIIIAIVALMSRHRGVATGGGLLMGGSLGNLLDRLVHGGVTDFLDPARWPAFNLADIAIVSGAALIALGLLSPDHHGKREGESPPWSAR